MDLNPYLATLSGDLERVTALADDATRETTQRLVTALEPALRLAMTQLLSDAAAEASSRLSGDVVTVRMDGREPTLQVAPALRAEPTEPTLVLPPAAPGEQDGEETADEAGTARVTVRLPDSLKRRAETLAGTAGQSLNTWIVQAIRAATEPTPSPPATRTHRSTNRLTGWA